MKILIVGNGSIGVNKKSEFYINNHTGYFLKKLKKFHAVTFTQGSTKYDKDNNLQNFELNENAIEYCTLPGTKTKSFIPTVFKLLKDTEFVYFFYPGTQSKLIALLAILIKKPFGLYIRGQYYNKNFLDRFILKRTKFILTVSPSFVKNLNHYCPRVKVIKPMIDIGNEDLNRVRNFCKKKKKNLLFVGRVEERKGIWELLEIAKALKKNRLDFTLNIVGGGDLFRSIETRITELGLGSNVILHGLISDKYKLKSLYDQADLFVFTSHDEGFPRVLYEAMASALPIFTTFVGGIPGRMVHLENCVEIPVKNSLGASELILKYFSDVPKLQELGENGLRTVEKLINGHYLTHEEILIKQLNNED